MTTIMYNRIAVFLRYWDGMNSLVVYVTIHIFYSSKLWATKSHARPTKVVACSLFEINYLSLLQQQHIIRRLAWLNNGLYKANDRVIQINGFKLSIIITRRSLCALGWKFNRNIKPIFHCCTLSLVPRKIILKILVSQRGSADGSFKISCCWQLLLCIPYCAQLLNLNVIVVIKNYSSRVEFNLRPKGDPR